MIKKICLTILFTLVLSGGANAEIIKLSKCLQGQNNYPEFKKADWKALNYDDRNLIYYKFLDEPKKNKFDYWELADEVTGKSFALMDPKDQKQLIKDGYKKVIFAEKHLYSINTSNSTINYLFSYTDEYLKYQQEYFYKWKKLEPNRNRNESVKYNYDYYSNLKKTKLVKYTIVDYVDGLIIAERNDQSKYYPEERWSILVDLKKMTVTVEQKNRLFNSYQGFFKVCTSESESGGSSGGSSGTAFFVSNKGHLLTNNHVVDGCKVSKITYQDKDYDTQLLATDKTLDLALLKTDLRNKSYLNFSGDEAKKMQKIYVGGYPLGKGLSDDLKI